MKTFADYISALEQAPQTAKVKSALSLARACLSYPDRTPDTIICANGPSFRSVMVAALAEAK